MEPFTKDLLDRAKGLVGVVLRGVRYYDQRSAPTEGPYGHAGAEHTTHFGVELRCDGVVVSAISSDEFTDGTFELTLVAGPASERRGELVATPLDDEFPWSELIGQRIQSSKIHWVDSPYVALPKRRKAFSSHHYDADGATPFSGPQAPFALQLNFANGGQVLLVSGSWKGVDQAIAETGPGISVLTDATTFAVLVPRIAKALKKSW